MRKTIKILGSLLFLLLVFVYLNFFSSFIFPWQEKDAIQTTLNWGGLAELPKEAENLTVEKEGSAFTRTFIVKFNANQKEIENWILNSKRLKNNKPKVSGETKSYEVHPGENESFGGKVSVEKGLVTIRMSWS
ncbi:hypothetical protein IU405_11835 [Polaribacter sp. BAL334]|uniref:hypothetical protein n=1 Tax=Polaribacter sp. BAL334 TaxID=1708178 RepID=UPI0018D1FA22|nr:hypothetical protein [Polaribacter sp. BAL334]MBG7612938.1 hypothetical protein [Polaribacter sp. BAL334]